MDYYKEFTAIEEMFGLSEKELKDFVEEKVKIAEEKEKLKIAREEEMRKIAKEEERRRQIIEREERAARRELEQIKNDNLKLQIDLQSRGQNPGDDANVRSTPKDKIKVRKYDSKKENNGKWMFIRIILNP